MFSSKIKVVAGLMLAAVLIPSATSVESQVGKPPAAAQPAPIPAFQPVKKLMLPAPKLPPPEDQVGLYWATISPDGEKVIGNWPGDREVPIWEVDSGQVLHRLNLSLTLDERFFSTAFSPDGKILALTTWKRGSSGRIHLFDVKTMKKLGFLEGHVEAIGFLEFTADSRTLMTGSYEGTVFLWDVSKAGQ